MKPKKKNATLTYLCSFVPGAAEMYMGFMKLGVSMLLLFFIGFVLPMGLRAEEVAFVAAFVGWCFSFFHARNIAKSGDEEFALIEDHYIWEEFSDRKPIAIPAKKWRKWLAVVLILLGLNALWGVFTDLVYRYIPDYLWDNVFYILENVPRVAFAVIIIAFGINIIKGKKEELDGEGA